MSRENQLRKFHSSSFLLLLSFVLLSVTTMTTTSSATSDTTEMQRVNSTERRTSIATSQLALSMLNNLDDPNDNAVISPISIQTVLNMLYLGSSNATRNELAKHLGYESQNLLGLEPHDAMHKIVLAIKAATAIKTSPMSDTKSAATGAIEGTKTLDLTAAGGGRGRPERVNEINFNLANLMLTSESMKIGKSYSEKLHEYYDVQMETFNANTTSESEIVDRVNQWVTAQTQQKITRILEELNLGPNGILMANAAYFKGHWLHVFNSQRNTEAIFYQEGQESKGKSATFMRQTAEFGYVNLTSLKSYDESLGALDCEALLMPFSVGHGHEVSMLILLPRTRKGLYEMTEKLNGQLLEKIYDALDYRDVYVEIPKFKFERQLDLKNIMAKLGITRMFTDSNGFSQMFDPPGSPGVHVDQLVHKALIEMDEEGATAAAVTMTLLLRSSLRPAPIPQFVANHPFLFIISHNPSNMPLFMGLYSRVQ